MDDDINVTSEIDLMELIEREDARDLTLRDYLDTCTRQRIPWSRGVRVWRASGGDFQRAIMVLQTIEEARNALGTPRTRKEDLALP